MNTLNKKMLGAAIAATLTLAGTAQAGTLQDVQKSGKVKCGISGTLAGFSFVDDKGQAKGLDVDYCRAVAAAALGDSEAVEYKNLTAKVRFTALTSGEIDVLSRNTTETMSRDTDHGSFVGINYYDGQGFMVKKDLGVTSAKELNGAVLCTQTGTTTELNAADYFRSNGMDYEIVAFEAQPETVTALEAGRCDVLTNDRSGLAAQRTRLSKPDDYMVLPDVISKEPLGPLVRHGDNQWEDVARWSLRCMVNAEELGVNSGNVEEMKKSNNPAIQRMLGVNGEFGKALGISNDWCANIITQVGNYGESYETHVGPNTPLKLERGLNALWTQGGIMYGAPIR